jgi:hypothetical protein
MASSGSLAGLTMLRAPLFLPPSRVLKNAVHPSTKLRTNEDGLKSLENFRSAEPVEA